MLIAVDLCSIQVMAAPQTNNEGEDGQCSKYLVLTVTIANGLNNVARCVK